MASVGQDTTVTAVPSGVVPVVPAVAVPAELDLHSAADCAVFILEGPIANRWFAHFSDLDVCVFVQVSTSTCSTR